MLSPQLSRVRTRSLWGPIKYSGPKSLPKPLWLGKAGTEKGGHGRPARRGLRQFCGNNAPALLGPIVLPEAEEERSPQPPPCLGFGAGTQFSSRLSRGEAATATSSPGSRQSFPVNTGSFLRSPPPPHCAPLPQFSRSPQWVQGVNAGANRI